MAEDRMPESHNKDELEVFENDKMFEEETFSMGNSDWMSDASCSADSDSEDLFLHERLQQPTKYFQELDHLESRVFENSLFDFYMDTKARETFGGHYQLKVAHGGNTPLKRLNEKDIKVFYEEVLNIANEAASQITSPPIGEHNNAKNILDRALEGMFHLIECRNTILYVTESIEAMEKASYCGDVISMLVIDKTDRNVAKLLPIQCSKIKQLATAFEDCLFQLVQLHPSMVLVDTEMAFANDVSEICGDFLSGLNLGVHAVHCTELWRCAVHVLDVAVLSYAGAHTEYFGADGVKYFTLPGPFLRTQFYVFRRRTFLCLNEFLDGQEAWVLERYNPDSSQTILTPLYLSTDATTFGDIWGPMWKSCALLNGQADPERIFQYNVGGGVILPWSPSPSDSQDSISSRKDHVFCHWISDKDVSKISNLVGSSRQPLYPNSILLIGARMKLNYNLQCNLSTDESAQRLRDSDSLSELGTLKHKRVIHSETVQIQVNSSHIKAILQRTYKRRGRTWKQALIEEWKNNPESRNPRMLEYKFGVEVSACTYNARRRRLITLLGSNTMMNHLRNGSIQWQSTDCENDFYTALQNSDYRAFRTLYKSRTDWQSDLGNAIAYCLDGLAETGVNDHCLDLLWVPDIELRRKVSIKFREHNWIGLLKDTEDSCTMAVFEDKCLELPGLIQIRRCPNLEIRPRPATASMSNHGVTPSALETSFLLNQHAIPKSMSQVAYHKENGTTSQDDHLWNTSLLKTGENFHFGESGQLKFIKSIGTSQVLANWKPPPPVLKEILRAGFQGKAHDNRHREYIRDEKAKGGPIYAIVLSSEAERTPTVLTPSETLPPISQLESNPRHVRQTNRVPSGDGHPRNSAIKINKMRQVLNSWRRGEPPSLNGLQVNGLSNTITDLVAALPQQEGNGRGEQRREAQ